MGQNQSLQSMNRIIVTKNYDCEPLQAAWNSLFFSQVYERSTLWLLIPNFTL